MINVFIFYPNLNSLLFLSNSIIQVNKNIKLIGIHNSISKESISQCISLKPDIIILTNNYNKKISKTLNFDYIKIVINNNDITNPNRIFNLLKKFSLDTKFSNKLRISNLRKKIFTKLCDLKFNPNLCGTYYLLDCIIYSYENPNFSFSNTQLENFFKVLSEKYNTNPNSILWNINTTIKEMCNVTSKNFRKNYYGLEFGINYLNVIKAFSNLY
jgi:hypothetical protein